MDTTQKIECRICGTVPTELFEVQILRKYQEMLYECSECSCAFFSQPTWLDEAYSKAISDLDTGLLERSVDISNVLTPFLFFSRFRKASVLDFGGGIGVLARMMRDRGFRTSSHDPLAESVFSIPVQQNGHSPVITMIEVLEHLTDPMRTLRELSSQSSLIFISTLAQPSRGITPDWWYLLPDTGQHIFFPSSKSFDLIAQQLGWRYFGNGKNLHVLSAQRLNTFQKLVIKNQVVSWMLGHLMYPVLRSRGLGKSDMEEMTTTVFGPNN
jgi:hypothetical protein